ncbi:MAG: type II toxin-antitoxin system mRNA interferase toxin, RelE/StbE family [Patescibacteria group bacterium]
MKIDFHHQCDKDLARLKKSGWKMEPFAEFLRSCQTWPLPVQYEAHVLLGDQKGVWDIHIRQNWIVLLKKEDNTIKLLRTGTHAMLGIA